MTAGSLCPAPMLSHYCRAWVPQPFIWFPEPQGTAVWCPLWWQLSTWCCCCPGATVVPEPLDLPRRPAGPVLFFLALSRAPAGHVPSRAPSHILCSAASRGSAARASCPTSEPNLCDRSAGPGSPGRGLPAQGTGPPPSRPGRGLGSQLRPAFPRQSPAELTRSLRGLRAVLTEPSLAPLAPSRGRQQALHAKWRPSRTQGVLRTHRLRGRGPQAERSAPGRGVQAPPWPRHGAVPASQSPACLSSTAGRSQDARFPQDRQGGHQRGQGVRVHAAEEVRATPARAGLPPGSLQGAPGCHCLLSGPEALRPPAGAASPRPVVAPSIPAVTRGGQWFVKLPRLETVRKEALRAASPVPCSAQPEPPVAWRKLS